MYHYILLTSNDISAEFITVVYTTKIMQILGFIQNNPQYMHIEHSNRLVNYDISALSIQLTLRK